MPNSPSFDWNVRAKERFEIFKRDNFTCQYCGAKAPEAQLHVDHIIPRSKDGMWTPDNLITACSMCNVGKSNRLLTETSL